MKKKRKPQPVKPSNLWTCQSCPLTKALEHQEMMDHMKQVHNITDPKGKRMMTLHLDGTDSYTSQYQWTIGGLEFCQTVTTQRAPDDPMRYI